MAPTFGSPTPVVITDKSGNLLNSLSTVGTASLNSSSSSPVTLIAAGAAGIFHDISTLIITNESSTATVVSLSDGTVTYKFAIAANGGGVFNFVNPLPASSAAVAWTVSNSAAVALDYIAVYTSDTVAV